MWSTLRATRLVAAHLRRSPVLHTMSINPGAMYAVANFVDGVAFGASALTRPQEEAIAVAVSAANKCRF
jgi:alkylhydroperoxidase family enzyme